MTSIRTAPQSQSRDLRSVWARYGGGDIPATFGGLVAAIGTLLMLAGLIAAGAGNIAFQTDVFDIEGNAQELSIAGAATAAIVLFVSFFVGGWVAARMARFDGRKNGVIVALWMLTLAVLFGALGVWAGAEYNLFARLNLPDWVSQWNSEDVALGTALAASVSVLVTFAGGYLGGAVGEAHNNRVNAAIANAPEGSIING